jgi:hypothetical protein
MPADLKVPETRPEAGIDHVDVMAVLGLKRAAPINAAKTTTTTTTKKEEE